MLRAEPGTPWDLEWTPIDTNGFIVFSHLADPLGIRLGGTCKSCGGHEIGGSTILLKSDLYEPQVRYEHQVQVFAIMACGHWHDYILVTSYPEVLDAWMFDAHRLSGEMAYTKGDVCDALSDRWHRWSPFLTDYEGAKLAFREAQRDQLQYRLEWPLPNV